MWSIAGYAQLHFHLREEALKERNFRSFRVEWTAILMEDKISAEFVRKIIKTSISRKLFKEYTGNCLFR